MMAKKTGKWLKNTLDLSDLVGLGGLGMAFYGLYQWKPFAAYIVIGAVLFGLSIISNLEDKKPNG